ncbi:hypothetical protein BaRGS_00014415 [Batillaria attramentaria]|uniref:C2H2-type domain-containing protein n=1 Tax=Batillaria attramentaria TaxID=370345 RepID=A0ABD0L4I7_9CAEN
MIMDAANSATEGIKTTTTVNTPSPVSPISVPETGGRVPFDLDSNISTRWRNIGNKEGLETDFQIANFLVQFSHSFRYENHRRSRADHCIRCGTCLTLYCMGCCRFVQTASSETATDFTPSNAPMKLGDDKELLSCAGMYVTDTNTQQPEAFTECKQEKEMKTKPCGDIHAVSEEIFSQRPLPFHIKAETDVTAMASETPPNENHADMTQELQKVQDSSPSCKMSPRSPKAHDAFEAVIFPKIPEPMKAFEVTEVHVHDSPLCSDSPHVRDSPHVPKSLDVLKSPSVPKSPFVLNTCDAPEAVIFPTVPKPMKTFKLAEVHDSLQCSDSTSIPDSPDVPDLPVLPRSLRVSDSSKTHCMQHPPNSSEVSDPTKNAEFLETPWACSPEVTVSNPVGLEQGQGSHFHVRDDVNSVFGHNTDLKGGEDQDTNVEVEESHVLPHTGVDNYTTTPDQVSCDSHCSVKPCSIKLKRMFCCGECKTAGFTDSASLNSHMLNHQKEKVFVSKAMKPYKCQTCRLTFSCSSGLRRHMSENVGKKPYVCNACNSAFTHVCKMRQHMLKHGEKMQLSCEMCQKTFVSLHQWRVHMEEHAETHRIQNLCGVPSSDHREAAGHLIKSHASGECKKSFAQARDLEKRVQFKHTGERSSVCEICGLSFADVKVMKKHRQIHKRGREKRFVCEVCNSRFHHHASLKYHRLTHSGQKSFVCEHCKIAFYTASHLKCHVKLKHLGTSRPRTKAISCHICLTLLRSKSHLKEHMHLHTGEKPYTCDVCSSAFVTLQNVRRHKATAHTEERPYVCEHCSTTFKTICTLKIHLRTHTKEKPYVCDQCGATFSQHNAMTRHALRHSGKKPYTCQQCGISFTQSYSLTIHMRRHTGERPYKCQVCDSSFIDSYGLKKHCLKHTLHK